MKTKSILITSILIVAVAGFVASSCGSGKSKAEAEKVMLFNGKDLNNWAFHLRTDTVDPAGVFTVKDGVILITGNPFGYMRTVGTYENYSLNIEWRYPIEASNSGVFIHAQLPDTIWPQSFECQLKAGNAGDFVCMNGSDMNERTDKSVRVVKKMTESNEKPVGEWNTMVVNCKDDTMEVFVNGVLQNKGTGLSITSGHICMQSEGKAIEFKNIFITKL